MMSTSISKTLNRSTGSFIPIVDMSQRMESVIDIVMMSLKQQKQAGCPKERHIQSWGEGKQMK